MIIKYNYKRYGKIYEGEYKVNLEGIKEEIEGEEMVQITFKKK